MVWKVGNGLGFYLCRQVKLPVQLSSDKAKWWVRYLMQQLCENEKHSSSGSLNESLFEDLRLSDGYLVEHNAHQWQPIKFKW